MVSIPKGSIKSQFVELKSVNVFRFQFQKVRLKGAGWNRHVTTKTAVSIPKGSIKRSGFIVPAGGRCLVSIPKGSIKRHIHNMARSEYNEFQFQKVRLKALVIVSNTFPKSKFQFQKVRLKAAKTRRLRLSGSPFQFQKVRLKAVVSIVEDEFLGLFQFQKVRLKVGSGCSNEWVVQLFQFQKVRLKVVEEIRPFIDNHCFNSKRFD